MRKHVSSSSRFRWARPVLVTATVVAIAWVGAGDLNPPPGAIQPTNRVQLNNQVITLPFTINECGSYVLTSSLTGVAGQHGIVIDADDVTLDLNGFCLTGVPGSLDAILVNGPRKNTTIRNGTISGWDGNGINAVDATNEWFEVLSIGSSGLDGIWLGSDGTIRGLNITGSGKAGIRVGGARNRVEENHVTQCGTGFLVDGLDNLIIRNSAVGNSADYSIAAGNAFGPIAAVGGVGDISAVPAASHPWANFGLTCVPRQWCFDADRDGFGDTSNTTFACAPPPDFVADCTDCDDAEPGINPGKTEVCDTLDNDCDGAVDEGNPGGGAACDGPDADLCVEGVLSCVAGSLTCSDTTNDNVEVCNGADDDCNGVVDEGITCGPNSSCLSGACSCAAGTQDCNASLTDGCESLVNFDVNNCGSCGTACLVGGVCASGACGCPAGGVDCDGVCAILSSEANNCGACGTVCPSGASCVNGTCTCPSGQTACSGSCVDLASDVKNCGQCDGMCPSGATCANGSCQCPAGQSNCGSVCANRLSDPNNCGSCGNVCPGGTSCVNAVCTGSVQDGTPCSSSVSCLSGFCIDGVCCNTLCNVLCATCNRAGFVGVCAPVPAEQDPDNECPGSELCNGALGCCLSNGAPCTSNGSCCSSSCSFGRCQ